MRSRVSAGAFAGVAAGFAARAAEGAAAVALAAVAMAAVPGAGPAAAQDTLRLPALQAAALDGDPRLAQVALEERATALRLRSLAAERLPSFSLTGEATSQSEVAAVPIDLPDRDIPAPPRERWEVALNADWLLLDGGATAARRAAERADLAARQAELAATLYPLRAEVQEAFFGALLLQEGLVELGALIGDLEARLGEVRSGVVAGAALPADTAAVRAELLRAVQRRDELEADRRAALAVLAGLTGRPVSESDVLVPPDLAAAVARVDPGDRQATARSPSDPDAVPPLRAHPRYAVFDARRERLEREAAVVRSRLRPRVSAFGRFAYGTPGFEQFTDEPHDYWLGGVRVRWAPWDWRATARDAEVLGVRARILETEEAAFTDELRRRVRGPLEAMARLGRAIELDEQIIALREQVERQARARLGERAITAAAYVDARTDLEEARSARLRHRAELARAQALYLTILGVDLQ